MTWPANLCNLNPGIYLLMSSLWIHTDDTMKALKFMSLRVHEFGETKLWSNNYIDVLKQ